MPETSPPKRATSRTRLDDRNEYCGLVDKKNVSMPGEPLVHLRHLQLVVEVGDGPQALHDRVGAVLAGEVDEQPLEELDADVVEVRGRLLQHLLALFEAEQRLRLLRVADHRDDDLVEVTGRTLDDVEVAEGHRVERSRAEGGRHAVSPVRGRIDQRNRKVKSVSPKVRSQPLDRPGGATRGGGPAVRR